MNAEMTGKLIAELRKEKNLTQSQLAEMLHVSDKAVSRWETGRGFPDINILEDLSDCLGISVAEIIRGERLAGAVSREELQGLSAGWLSLAKSFMNRRKVTNVIIGFLLGAIVLAVLMIHITSPVYITDPAEALSIEQLPDGRILASLGEDVAGFDIERISGESGNYEIRVSCYQTKLNKLMNKKNDSLVLLGEKDNTYAIYYYPTGGEDKLLYSSGETSPYSGTLTLPRLVYNYWILIGLILALAGAVACYICRRKYYVNVLLRLTALPVAFVVSTVLCLAGRFKEVYNAQFYLSGIMLLTMAVYLLFMILIEKIDSISKERKNPSLDPNQQ